MRCEMCGNKIDPDYAYCAQHEPVQRDICYSCAEKDQRATHPRRWRGTYHPTDAELGLS
jgi:ribosome-binding protein aMBF1 (putative translation factor)